MRLCSFVVVLLLASCSTNWRDFLSSKKDTEKRNEELLKDFSIDEDVHKKFSKVTEENKPAPKKKVSKKVKKVAKKQEVKKVVTKKRWPEAYPRNLIDQHKSFLELKKHFQPKFIVGEQAVIDINYLGVSTGKIILSTMPAKNIAGTDAYHINAKVKTARFYSYLYELDDHIDSYISKQSLNPIKFSLIQRESGKDVDDLQLFDADKMKVFSFYKKVKKGKVTKRRKENFTPVFFQDPLSLIYFIRGLDFSKKKQFRIPFFNKGNLKFFGVKYAGEEVIDTNIGKKKAIKILASSDYAGDTLKSGDMFFWFSADSKRVFLKFNAKITIGSVSGDIEQYK